jgi:hypothetical protein
MFKQAQEHTRFATSFGPTLRIAMEKWVNMILNFEALSHTVPVVACIQMHIATLLNERIAKLVGVVET